MGRAEVHSLAVGSDGSIWGWGQQTNGQTGDGTTEPKVLSPVELSGPSSAVGIAAGTNHSLGVTSGGSVWAWGLSTYGQVGDGTTLKRLAPVRVSEDDFGWKAATRIFDLTDGTYTGTQSVTITATEVYTMSFGTLTAPGFS